MYRDLNDKIDLAFLSSNLVSKARNMLYVYFTSHSMSIQPLNYSINQSINQSIINHGILYHTAPTCTDIGGQLMSDCASCGAGYNCGRFTNSQQVCCSPETGKYRITVILGYSIRSKMKTS